MVETISTNAPKFTRECDQCGQRRTELYLHRNGITAYCEGCYIQYRREADGVVHSSMDSILRQRKRPGRWKAHPRRRRQQPAARERPPSS